MHTKKSISNDTKKDKININYSVTEIQVSNLDTRTKIEDNDSSDWRHLPEIPSTSEDSNSGKTDDTEWLDEHFYQNTYTVSNLEYAKLKWSNFVVKLQNCDPIIA